jgi:hypothetical protein
MSAAIAEPVMTEPEIIASAVANKTTFFMTTIPITFQKPAQFREAPRAIDTWLKSISLTRPQSGTR